MSYRSGSSDVMLLVAATIATVATILSCGTFREDAQRALQATDDVCRERDRYAPTAERILGDAGAADAAGE